jgi:hypothetical protein
MVKNHIAHSGLDIIEKRLTPGEYAAEQGILIIAPFQDGSELLGHSSLGLTLDTDSHVLPDMQQQAVAAMDKLLMN